MGLSVGIMGLADMLIKMHITYGSKEAIDICDKIGRVMANTAIAQSAMLAKEYGTFPKFDVEKTFKSEYFDANTSPKTAQLVQKYGLRNSQLLTIAPTGLELIGSV